MLYPVYPHTLVRRQVSLQDMNEIQNSIDSSSKETDHDSLARQNMDSTLLIVITGEEESDIPCFRGVDIDNRSDHSPRFYCYAQTHDSVTTLKGNIIRSLFGSCHNPYPVDSSFQLKLLNEDGKHAYLLEESNRTLASYGIKQQQRLEHGNNIERRNIPTVHLQMYNISSELDNDLRVLLTHLVVQTLTGKRFDFYVHTSATVNDISKRIELRERIPISQQRLIFKGQQLKDPERRLSDYGIDTASNNTSNDSPLIHLVLRLNISRFSSSLEGTPTVAYLMLPEEQRPTAPIPYQHLEWLSTLYHANKNGYVSFVERPRILSDHCCWILSEFLDWIWDTTNKSTIASAGDSNQRVDLRASVHNDRVAEKLFSYCQEDETDVSPIVRLLQTGTTNIFLRITRGPTHSCIDFHCDTAANTAPTEKITVQIPLLDGDILPPSNGPVATGECHGGKLLFYINGTIVTAQRLPGSSMTIHAANVLHGVTAMTSGIRRSLFVVWDSSGAQGRDGKDDEILEVDEDMVDSFCEWLLASERLS